MTLLYADDDIMVRAVEAADAHRWVVTFESFHLDPTFDRPGFGEDYLASIGISAVHVLVRHSQWYQHPTVPAALAAIRRRLAGAGRVMTFGSSMGGYAAIRFADAVGAQAALALSPQYSMDPAKVPFEKRWGQASRTIRPSTGQSAARRKRSWPTIRVIAPTAVTSP